ncbi:MAG: hypothetical protein LBQ54_03555 [Planctomycetaceae bacterium]|jgi:hypothetical protein|nr:hypothetical protein [Planctomycetaceae bacterium]
MFFSNNRKMVLPLMAMFLMLFSVARTLYAQESEPVPQEETQLVENQNVTENGTEEASPVTEEKPAVEKTPKPEPAVSKPVAVIEKEQTVYVPYEKLRGAFESEGRGVFLPYAEFRKLWDAAKRLETPQPAPEPEKAPIPAMITETDSIAKINGDLVEVTATVKFDLLEPGWHTLPLQLQGVAITEAILGGEPAQILGDNQNGYSFLVERKKDAPVRRELTLCYAKSYEKSPGRNSVSLRVPQAPLSRWEFRMPDTGVKVDFAPMIAASEFPPENGTEGTIFRAFAGSAPNVQIGWTPKAEGAKGLEALANVQSQQRVTVEEGVIRNRVHIVYSISRAQLDKLAIEVPEDQKVVGVVDDNIRSWEISQGEKTQVIQVELFEPAKSKQSLLIDLEKFIPETDHFSIDVPRIKIIGVGAHQGTLAVDTSPGLVCEQKKMSGLVQIDPAELPQNLKIRATGLAYRLSAAVYGLELAVEKERPQIFAKTQTRISLSSDGDYSVQMVNAYQIEKAGVFQLFYDVPEGLNVMNVSGDTSINVQNLLGRTAPPENRQSQSGSSPQQPTKVSSLVIDGYQLSDLPTEEGKPKRKRLTVNLARKAIGIVGVAVRFYSQPLPPQPPQNRDAQQKETEKAFDLKIIVPVVASEGIEQKEGILVLESPDSLRVTPTAFTGMQNVPREQLADKWIARPILGNLAYVFAGEQPELSLQAMRRTPQVTIKQLLTARIDDGVVRFSDKIAYNVLYSGVPSLRIDVPKEISKDLRNQTKDFRDTVLSPQPEDVAEGYEAWNFANDTNLQGTGTIILTWEKQIPQLLDGKSVEISVPRLIPQKVFRSWGQILLAKTGTVDISTSDVNNGLRQIDPQHDVEAEDRIADAAYGFEFHEDWKLSLSAMRYEWHEVKRASIEYALIRHVLTRANTQSVQALYRIQSVKQRLPVILPPDSSFDVEPRINDVPVTLETDAAGQYLIPLTSTLPDKPFLLEIRYTQKKKDAPPERKHLSRRETIAIPVFPDEPAIQHVYVAVYVPEEYVLTSYQGNCSKNFHMFPTFQSDTVGISNSPGVDMVTGVLTQELEQRSSPSWRNFPVDGSPYLFSTIQPDSDNAGLFTIRLRKISFINVVMFLLLLTGGILLMFYKWRIRGIVVFSVIILYALLVLIAPTLMFTAGVVSGVRWAIGLTVILWIIRSLVCGWSTFKTIMTTPLTRRKTETSAEVTTSSENTEGGPHA